MKEQWHNPVESLKSDLSDLINNLVDNFPPDIQEQIRNHKIGVQFDKAPLKIKTPVADLESGEIIMQEVHLGFLWCCSYVTVALNTMLYEEVREHDQDVVPLYHRSEFPKVQLTLAWARSLQKEVTSWPAEAARPDQPDKWTESATNLFQACAAYLLFHETAHLVLHRELAPLISAGKTDPFYKTTVAEDARIFSAELEADEFALNCLMQGTADDNVRLVKYLGASLAHLSNFYLLDIPDTRGGNTHPDLDDRLKAVLHRVNFGNEENMIQFQMNTLAGLQLFFILTETPYLPENGGKDQFPQADDLEKYLLNLITNMKNAARGHTY